MRITLLYSNPNVGGAETFGVAVAERWQRDHDVAVVNLSAGGGPLRSLCQQANVPFIGLGGGSRLFRPRTIRRLRNTLGGLRPQIVLVFGLRLQLLTRLCSPWLSNRAVWISMLRGQDPWRNRFHVLADRWTQHRFACHVANSRAVCQLFCSREKYPADRIVYIPNGIDVGQFCPAHRSSATRRQLGIPECSLVCTTVANMRPMKGHTFLSQVLLRYAQEFIERDVRFLWIGRHEGLGAQLHQQLCAAGLKDHVVAPGPASDVRPYLAASDLFVLPSQSESMPRGLMEAMAMGIPCIATSVGGTAELIEHGRSGVLVGSSDMEAMGRAILLLASHPGLREGMGRRAATRMQQGFSLERISSEYIRLFECLSDGAQGSIGDRIAAYRAGCPYERSLTPAA